jgi:hypothetical protein
MVQVPQGVELPAQAARRRGIRPRREHLQRDRVARAAVDGPIDGPEAAAADLSFDPEWPQ